MRNGTKEECWLCPRFRGIFSYGGVNPWASGTDGQIDRIDPLLGKRSKRVNVVQPEILYSDSRIEHAVKM